MEMHTLTVDGVSYEIVDATCRARITELENKLQAIAEPEIYIQEGGLNINLGTNSDCNVDTDTDTLSITIN